MKRTSSWINHLYSEFTVNTGIIHWVPGSWALGEYQEYLERYWNHLRKSVIESIFDIEIRAADAGLNECGGILRCLGEASYTLRQQENDYKRRRTLHVLAL